MSRRIDRILTDEHLIVLIMTGRIAGEHVETLRRLLEQEVVTPVVDLLAVIEADVIEREGREIVIISPRQGTRRRAPAAVPPRSL
jgi:hypothetical protein